MIVLYILGGILLLILLLSSVRIGIRAEFGQETKVTARIGPCQISVLPKAEKQRKEPGKKTENKDKKTENKSTKKPALSLSDIRSAMPAVWESLQKGFKKSGQKMKLDPLELCIIFGGDDPADTAEWYGWASGALWTVMPRLQEMLQIPSPQIHLGVDFNAPKTVAEGKVGIWCRVSGIFAIGHAFAKPALKWFFANRKQKKQAEKMNQTEPKNTKNRVA